MQRLRLLPLVGLLALAGACTDKGSEVLAPEDPSFIAFHEGGGSQISLDANDLLVQINGLQVTLTVDWEDDQAWDLVSFDLSQGNTKLNVEWNLAPYAGGNGSRQFSFTETLPQAGNYRYCVEAMAKNKSGKGTPTTTHHARECVDVNVGVPIQHGLLGQYYTYSVDNTWSIGSVGPSNAFQTLVLTRIDPVLDFNWGFGSPAPGVLPSDYFAVRWTGHISPDVSGTYEFCPISDDGYTFTFNGTTYLFEWKYGMRDPNNCSGAISMTAGTKYPIAITYFEATGEAVFRLRYKTTGQTQPVVVPSTWLYPS